VWKTKGVRKMEGGVKGNLQNIKENLRILGH
jgi:hypothetical protein